MSLEDNAILSTFMEVMDSFNLHNHRQFSLENDPDAKISISGINVRFYNGIYLKHPQNYEKLADEIHRIHSELKKPLTVWMTHETEAEGLEHILNREFESPGPFHGMFLQTESAKPTPFSEDISIEPVENQKQAEVYAQMVSTIFNLPGLAKPMTEWAVKQYESREPICLNFIANIEGKPAGISTLAIDRQFSGFKTGGFYNAGVLPEFRNKGIGTAMANHRLNIAKEMGVEALSIVLMSDAMTRGYCEHLGFENYQKMTPWFVQ